MVNMNSIPTVSLLDGNSIPQLGYGVFRIDPEDTERCVSEALEAGYRHIDTARIYGNEEGVGRAIAASGIPRDEIFVTTKLWTDDLGAGKAASALEASLERLQLDAVDLYLIHWPVPDTDAYLESWTELMQLRDADRTRSIGVCNMNIEHLERLIDAGETPVVNQVELHPLMSQPQLRQFCRDNDIAVEAWGPLAQGRAGLLEMPTVTDIARAHGKTPAQVVLRWHLHLGNIVFPKTTSAERMRENLDLFDFELSVDEMSALANLDRGERVSGADPETFGIKQ